MIRVWRRALTCGNRGCGKRYAAHGADPHGRERMALDPEGMIAGEAGTTGENVSGKLVVDCARRATRRGAGF